MLVSHDRYSLDQVTNCTGSCATKRCSSSVCPAPLRASHWRNRTLRTSIGAVRSKRDRPGGKSAKRPAIWGKVYDNEDLARKAKQMEKRVDRLKEEQTTLTAGSPWRLRLQGEALDADRLLALQQWAVRPAPDAPVLFSPRTSACQKRRSHRHHRAQRLRKSSLLRLLWQAYQHPAERPAIFHPRVRIGYYDQSLQQLRDEDTLSEALAQLRR